MLLEVVPIDAAQFRASAYARCTAGTDFLQSNILRSVIALKFEGLPETTTS